MSWLICDWQWAPQKVQQAGGGARVSWGHTFLKKNMEFLGLSLFPYNFQSKWTFAPLPWKNCVRSHRTSGSKYPDFLDPSWKCLFFFWLTSRISTLYIFNISLRYFKASTLPPVSNSFWNRSNCHATKIVIWRFR